MAFTHFCESLNSVVSDEGHFNHPLKMPTQGHFNHPLKMGLIYLTYNLSEMKVTFIIIEDADLFRDL